MNLSGLSLEQAPPLQALLNLFFIAPLFGILFGASLLFFPQELLFDRYSYYCVAVIHLFSIGFMMPVMFGALLQMLPVLAGVRFSKAYELSIFLSICIGFGVLFLSSGFIFYSKILLSLGGLFLGLSILFFGFYTLRLLFKTSYFSYTILAMKFSLISLIFAVITALFLLLSHTFFGISDSHFLFVNIHLIGAFFGWVVLLILGVSFQVIPMFYVAKEFPLFCRRFVMPGIFTAVLSSTLLFFIDFWSEILKILFFIFISAFSLSSGLRLRRRKRATYEPTVIFWYVALANFFIASIILLASIVIEVDFILLGVIFGIGGVGGVIHGMLYRIIPFLAWFHLSSKGFFDAPNMREILPFKKIDRQMYLFFSAYALLLLSFLFAPLVKISGAMFCISFLLLFLNIYSGFKIYHKVLNNGNITTA